jgi:hypothetical protein
MFTPIIDGAIPREDVPTEARLAAHVKNVAAATTAVLPQIKVHGSKTPAGWRKRGQRNGVGVKVRVRVRLCSWVRVRLWVRLRLRCCECVRGMARGEVRWGAAGS